MLEPTIEYEKGDIYYGSTTQPLHKRFFQHKHIFTFNSPGKSKMLFEKYGIENVKIILIKNHPCNNKSELEAEEATYIRNNKCVNLMVPGRSMKEWYEDNRAQILEQQKDYYENNKPKIQEYRETNKTKIQEYMKEYRKENKEKLIKQSNDHYNKNKTTILEKNKNKVICICGCEVSNKHLKKHQRTTKHINLLEKNKNNPSI